MKKLFSIVLALVLMLSLTVPAFADVSVDGSSKGTGEVTHEGDAHYVSANTSGDSLTVTCNVTGDDQKTNISVDATAGAEITVGGGVTEFGTGNAINATNGATVAVNGDVTEKDAGNAINATNGAKVTVNRDVTESGDGHAINADGSDTTVTVKGDVTENDTANAIYAKSGATVIVLGSVDENNTGCAINAASGATVKVGGDVKDGLEIATYSILANNAKVIVEGKVTGTLGASGELYLGQLDGNIVTGEKQIHYLIGTAAEGSAALSDVKLESDIVADKTIDGAIKEGYRYTTTANQDALKGQTIILKPADGKILTVEGYDGADVTYAADKNGTVTFTIGENFKGGLQNLVLILTDKPGSDPVYYLVPLGSVTVVEFTAPEGVEEGLIKVLNSANHAGLTVDSSLVGDGSVKVLKDGEELSANDFSIYTHKDGSVDVILSSTYLYALGNGSYDFTAVVGGLEIPFTVAVAI